MAVTTVHNDTPAPTAPLPRNVLIVRFALLGDVAMTIPVIYSVCAAHPDTRFIVATQPVASTLFVQAPANLTVVAVDVKQRYHGLRGMFRLGADLRKQYHIEAMVDLQDEPRSWALALALRLRGVGKTLRMDKGRKGKRALIRRRNKRMLPLLSSRDRYREVFLRLGFAYEETFTSIFPGGRAPEEMFAGITPPKQPGELWIAVAPFAKWGGKIYPMPLMERVLEGMAAWPGVRIFLLGQGERERDQFRQWARKLACAVSLGERRHGFPAELALLSHCDVMLSMDSSNMHLASLVRLPVVSVWGATHPYCGFMGWKQDESLVVQLNMACRPCSLFGNRKCHYRDYFCLTGIQPSLILSTIKKAVFNV